MNLQRLFSYYIKTLRSTTGDDLESAPPSTPVEITGLNDLPEAGDRLYALDDAAQAKQIAEERQQAKAKADRAERQKVTLEGLFDTIDQAKVKEIQAGREEKPDKEQAKRLDCQDGVVAGFHNIACRWRAVPNDVIDTLPMLSPGCTGETHALTDQLPQGRSTGCERAVGVASAFG